MKLGYTWYPENWWTSDVFFELQDNPILKYLYREIIDLLYSKGGECKINQDIINKRFRVELDDSEFNRLKDFFLIDGDLWESTTVKKRLSKAETARENGKKGGRPKTQKPRNKTQEETQKNPPLERESKRKNKSEIYRQEFLEKIIEIFDMYGGSEDEAKIFHDYYQKQDWIDNGGFDIRVNLDRKVENWIKRSLRKKQQHESSRRIPLYKPRPNRRNG